MFGRIAPVTALLCAILLTAAVAQAVAVMRTFSLSATLAEVKVVRPTIQFVKSAMLGGSGWLQIPRIVVETVFVFMVDVFAWLRIRTQPVLVFPFTVFRLFFDVEAAPSRIVDSSRSNRPFHSDRIKLFASRLVRTRTKILASAVRAARSVVKGFAIFAAHAVDTSAAVRAYFEQQFSWHAHSICQGSGECKFPV